MRWSTVACLFIGLCVGTYFLLQPEGLPKDALIAFEPVAEPAVSADVKLSIQPDTETKPPLMAAQPVVEGGTMTESKCMGK